MNNILVNATAARYSGALSILNQFIENIPLDGQNQYYIFVDPNFRRIDKPNVEYVAKDTQSWLNRIKWDEFGLEKWIRDCGLKFDLFISFQNTGAKINREIPQLIYYHQPLPLSDTKWNLMNKEERIFFFYKWFYSFFVNRYLTSNTQFVLQIPSIKDTFIRKFKIDERRTHVIKPKMSNIDFSTLKGYDFKDDCIHCIYPATPLVYKNHDDIIEALYRLKRKAPLLLLKIRVHFTFNSVDNESLYKKIVTYKLDDNIVFDGSIPFDRLLSYYKSSHVLLFPSYIETLGLPLLEAASAGIPIIVSDLPYARDVIGMYEGTTFVRLHDINDWCNAIIRICQSGRHYEPYQQHEEDGWTKFFELVDQLKIK